MPWEPPLPLVAIPTGPALAVFVIGAGQMGQLIAGSLALRGSSTVAMHDRSSFTRERALAAVRASLMELEADCLISLGATDEAMRRISVTDSFAPALSADLIIEAVPEDLELKRAIFVGLDKLVYTGKDAGPLLCSNSISLAPADIFKHLKHRR
jgi:3-hydroxybutyryl-CoA dehydrogenase